MSGSQTKAPHRGRIARRGSTDARRLAAIQRLLEQDVERLTEQVAVALSEHSVIVAGMALLTSDDLSERGSTAVDLEERRRLAENAERLLDQDRQALARMDRGGYGVCEACQRPIDVRRLEAFPSATQCLTCKAGRAG